VKPDSLGNQGPAPWGCDSLMINMNSYRQPMTRNNPYSSDVTLGFRYAPMGANPRGQLLPDANILNAKDMYWKVTPHGKWAVTEWADGWNVEAAIPWSDLGYTPRVGERIFLAIMLPDVDPGQSLKQLGWGMGGSMKDYPVFRLADRADALGLITLSSDEVATDKPWSARVELDARTGPATLKALRLIDMGGKTVLERKAPPTFNVMIEIQERGRLAVYDNVAEVVDRFLAGVPLSPEIRTRTEGGRVEISRAEIAEERKFEGAVGKPLPSPAHRRPRRRNIRIFSYGVSRIRLERVIQKLGAPAVMASDIDRADLILTLKSQEKRQPGSIRSGPYR